MPLLVVVEGSRYYACGECGLIYREERLAEECEEWCRAHGTCRVDLAKMSVGYIRRHEKGLRVR
jgi:hypothetical protein